MKVKCIFFCSCCTKYLQVIIAFSLWEGWCTTQYVMIQLTLGKLNVSWKTKSIVFNNQRGKNPENKASEINFICSLRQVMLKYRRVSRNNYKIKLCAKGLFSCPLLNICGSNFLVLLKSLPVYSNNVRKLSLKRCLGHLWVCLDKAVRWTLFWNVNQFIKRQTGLLLLCLFVV